MMWWYIHTIKCYPAIKKNEILIRTITWADLKNITLSEINQMQKDKYCMIIALI